MKTKIGQNENSKKFQMLVAENHHVALKNCHARSELVIPREALIEEKFLQLDLNRSCIISLDKSFEDLERNWLENYQPDPNNEYNQARIECNHIPDSKLSAISMEVNLLNVIDDSYGNNDITKTLSFSYYDENDNLCAFALSVFINFPSLWIASVTTNTTAPIDQRQVTVFAPESSRALIEEMMSKDNPNLISKISKAIEENKLKNKNREGVSQPKDEFYEKITKIIQFDEPNLVNMDLLKDYVDYAINNHFIKSCLTGLFDKNGINVDLFNYLFNLKRVQSSMFDFSDQKIEEISHQGILSQLLAGFKKLRVDSNNPSLYQQQIDLINDVIENYSITKFQDLIQVKEIEQFMSNFSQLKTRNVIEILSKNPLFPTDNYELQNAHLILLLGSYPNLALQKEIKIFQKLINDTYLNLNFISGLKKESLAKDLTILSSLLINPSSENFNKLQERIESNTAASDKRIVGGYLMTSGTIAILAGIAAGTLFIAFPLPAITTLVSVGFFAGTSSAVASFKSATDRNKYKSELQNVELLLIKTNPREWVKSKLAQILKGKNDLTIKTIMPLFQRVKTIENINILCNSLANAIFILNDKDCHIANVLKIVRELVHENSNLQLNSFDKKTQSISIESLKENIELAYKKLENVFEFTAINIVKKVSPEQIKLKEDLLSVIHCNQKITEEINAMYLRKTKNPNRDLIIIDLVDNLKGTLNKDELITYLDNAIIALLDNSNGSKIGKKLLELRESISPIEELSKLMISPSNGII
ncbi:MAG: hypothetical protein H0U73_10165 [Tatlockia sp.]|nr:hypothetical protein [Tatlockia sp.]